MVPRFDPFSPQPGLEYLKCNGYVVWRNVLDRATIDKLIELYQKWRNDVTATGQTPVPCYGGNQELLCSFDGCNAYYGESYPRQMGAHIDQSLKWQPNPFCSVQSLLNLLPAKNGVVGSGSLCVVPKSHEQVSKRFFQGGERHVCNSNTYNGNNGTELHGFRFVMSLPSIINRMYTVLQRICRTTACLTQRRNSCSTWKLAISSRGIPPPCIAIDCFLAAATDRK